ncbi:MAG TPA: aminotransferase class I/II-fold pyridoxal phosphate-dependent enzyme, partial [Candidatus Avanaerovorax faecigallinarum]|nr:aminotransferase class I/II-fold pyridoxal phosphate-dependent enzyme [Candidatus Avanaerovorax faecigallinarum]
VSNFFLTEENGFRYDEGAEEAVTDRTDLVFICNPNNPTGLPVEKEKVLSLAEKCRDKGSVLVIDECFSDFLEEEERYSFLPHIKDFQNVVVLKAFTKIFAMAGLRLGYAVCSDEKLVEGIKGTLQPWAVNTPASKAGAAAAGLSDFVKKTVEYVKAEREYLIAGFEKLGIKTYGSKANYVFVKSRADLKKDLEDYDILVRGCGNYPGLDETYFRFAVRTREENECLLRCLGDLARKEKL